MKKGISVWSFAEESLEKCFYLAKDAGFEGVEVALDTIGEVNLNSTKEDMEKIKGYAKAAGIELYSVASGLYWEKNYTDNDENIRKEAIEITKKQLELASWLGCQSILVVPGAVTADVDYDVAYERCFAALKELAPVAEEYKVELCIENVWNKFLLSPLEMRDMIDKVNSPYVAAYFDVGNVLLTGYPEQWIKILGSRIKKVHFKDYKTGVGTLDGFVDILAGDVDYVAVMNAFAKVGYDGWVTAEMLPPYKLFPETILYNTSNSMDKILGVK
ncbi:MAG: sugar phosphate isomerase/epimerase [Clostridia bacterium]|nr:sugar phosphate isomerase/epimerase [Clostridia bacterium]MBQ8637491.1 sugar phosphate isomerase/epimerase [Clostridia bacterium]